jgi:hypothetical protein
MYHLGIGCNVTIPLASMLNGPVVWRYIGIGEFAMHTLKVSFVNAFNTMYC